MNAVHGDDELGIPGHASHRGEIKRIQELAGELGLSYEAEGDMTRIALGDLLVEVRDEPGGEGVIQVMAVMPEPGSAHGVLCPMARVIDAIRGYERYEYSLESIAGYSTLSFTAYYTDIFEAYRNIEPVLRVLAEASK